MIHLIISSHFNIGFPVVKLVQQIKYDELSNKLSEVQYEVYI